MTLTQTEHKDDGQHGDSHEGGGGSHEDDHHHAPSRDFVTQDYTLDLDAEHYLFLAVGAIYDGKVTHCL